MDALRQDVRYALRAFAHAPLFTSIALVTLALGIGANTAIFSAVNALLFRPLPYPDDTRLVTFRQNQSLPDVEDVMRGARSFESAGAVTPQALDYTGGSEPLQVQAALTDRGLFETLGARPVLGRTFSAAEDAVGGERVAVLSWAFWQGPLGGDPSVLGKTIPLSGNPYTVIGVLPPSFALPERTADLFAPLRVVNPRAAAHRGVHFLRVYLRLAPGATLANAQAEMDVAARRLAEADPTENLGKALPLEPLRVRLSGDMKPALLVLFGAVALVLLVGSANFANLLLSRALARRREIAIRRALGAGRRRLVRQLLTESTLLSLAGGALGLAFAPWLIRLLVALRPAELPPVFLISLDLRVLSFTFVVSVATGILFGLVPALSATTSSDALSGEGRAGTASRKGMRASGFLVVAETALAIVLVVCAGLLVKTFWRLRATVPGFDPENVVAMRIELPESRYAELEAQRAFRRHLFDSLAVVPRAELGMVSELPLSGSWLAHNTIVEGQPAVAAGAEPEIHSRSVAGDYFRTMRIGLVSGRAFSRDDGPEAPLVAVVNESLARQYFPGRSPLGARVRWARQEPPQWMTIVGVARDVKQFGLEAPEEPAIYSPYDQSPQSWKRWMTLVVRSAEAPASVVSAVKSKLAEVDRGLPLTEVRTLRQAMASSLARQRFNMALLGLFAALGLVLAAIGIYGVMSHAVSRRTREIGIRMALGAARGDVLRLVIGQGLRLSLTGIGIGLVGALFATRLLAGLLYGVSPTDAPTFLGLSLGFVVVAFAACFVPARRATRVEPIAALRTE